MDGGQTDGKMWMMKCRRWWWWEGCVCVCVRDTGMETHEVDNGRSAAQGNHKTTGC